MDYQYGTNLLSKIEMLAVRGRLTDRQEIDALFQESRKPSDSETFITPIPKETMNYILEVLYPTANHKRAQEALMRYGMSKEFLEQARYLRMAERFALKSNFPHFLMLKLDQKLGGRLGIDLTNNDFSIADLMGF